MSLQRTSRLKTIMNNVGIIEKEANYLNKEQEPRDSIQVENTADKDVIKNHEHNLRESILNNVGIIEKEAEFYLNNEQEPRDSIQVENTADKDVTKIHEHNLRESILNNVGIIEKEAAFYLNNEQEPGDSIQVENTTDKDVVTKNHKYNLRESAPKSTYCEENNTEVNPDFSPDVSEYLPSPERLQSIQRSKSCSSIGGDSDYLDTAAKNMIKTPSTISNVSLVLNAVDLMPSPSPQEHNQRSIDLTPTSGHDSNGHLNKKSKRCLIQILNDAQPSTSSSSTNNYDNENKEQESTSLELLNLDETLQPENIDGSMLSDKTIVGNVSNVSMSSTNLLPPDIEVEEDSNSGQETAQKKNTRKRSRNDATRQDAKSKILKNSGEAYIGCRSKKNFDKKKLKACCKCVKKCGEKITHEQREHIMQTYYKIGDHERQWQYICNHTLVEDVKRVTVIRKRTRTQSIKYFFKINTEKIQVCKTFFVNTLSISHQTVYTALEKNKSDESLVDNRGRHKNRPRRMPIETEENITEHIQLFPNVESHYVRKDSTRKYLSELLTIAKMYRLYKDWFGRGNFDCSMATRRQYETIFNTKFNYSFYKPKKDQCPKCTRYRQADSTTQNTLQEKYDQHQKNKNKIREIKKQEKESVDPSETTIAIFDLEKVLNLPQSEVGSFHYKRKYPIYNFTVFDAIQKKGYCYVWHAQIAKRGANEIGSCLWQFLLNEKERHINNISFYSDGCCGQNKNRFIFSLYMFAAQKLQLNITHRFFETSHGQSEGDSMHATIERGLKNRVLYNPDQIYSIIMNAKVNGEKYNLKEMLQTEFYNIKELIENKNWVKNEEGQKVLWTQIMEVSVSYSQPSILKYKYDFEAEYSQLNTESVQKTRSKRSTRQTGTSLTSPIPASELELKVLNTEPLPISKALYDDLLSLCRSGDIPGYYHAFYESLSHTNSCSRVNDDEEEGDDED